MFNAYILEQKLKERATSDERVKLDEIKAKRHAGKSNISKL